MSIEIRQLVVKSNLLQRRGSDDRGGPHLEESRQDILEEVKGMIAEALRKPKER